MDFDAFLTIVWVVLLVVCGVGYHISNKYMYASNRSKRYVCPPRKGRATWTGECADEYDKKRWK